MKAFFKLRRWWDFRRRAVYIWNPCNVYESAEIGNNVSIGMFSEIGPGVKIGRGTRIGNGVFIPSGVTIGSEVFIGPHVCFSNDKYPPSMIWEWRETKVLQKAAIGANVSICPGIIIGKGALVGMGSVINCDIPDHEIWAGVPAKFIRKL